MSTSGIREALEGLEAYFQSDRYTGPRSDLSATAVMQDGLRCRTETPDGKFIHTDMSAAFGGRDEYVSPGWLARAALASCDATGLATRAIRLGIELDSIEVRVEAASDGRGLFLDQGISPASRDMKLIFRVGARDVPREKIQELVDWVVAHSPVGRDLEEPVAVEVELELV